MTLSERIAQRQQAEALRQGRVMDRARRAVSFDRKQGSTITPRDADDNARFDTTKEGREFWKFYATDLRARLAQDRAQQQ